MKSGCFDPISPFSTVKSASCFKRDRNPLIFQLITLKEGDEMEDEMEDDARNTVDRPALQKGKVIVTIGWLHLIYTLLLVYRLN